MARSGDLEIRRLRPGDGAQLAALLRDAFSEEFEGAGTDPAAVQRQVRAAGWVQRPGVRQLLGLLGAHFAYFVAVYRGRVIGSTAIGGGRLLVISSVAVLPEFRGLGVAQALLEQAHRFAIEHGRDRVALDVLGHNTPALRLYEKLGYVEYHRFRAYEMPRLPVALAVPAPRGYWLEPVSPRRAAAFGAIERAALPSTYFEVAPTLRERYVRPRGFGWLETLASGLRTHRRALIHEGRTVGYLLASVAPGHAEGRTDFPLVLPQANEGLPAALVDALRFVENARRSSARLDLSESRTDQHAQVEALGFRHRWTFLQMVRWLSTPVRIPIRVAEQRRLPYERESGVGSRES